MPKKAVQSSTLSQLLNEQTASTKASLEKNPTVDTTIHERGGVVPERHSRKKTTIDRTKVRSIFFDDRSWAQLDNANYNNRLNPQRIVQTAVSLFFAKYYDVQQDKLTPEGVAQVQRYEESITI